MQVQTSSGKPTFPTAIKMKSESQRLFQNSAPFMMISETNTVNQ